MVLDGSLDLSGAQRAIEAEEVGNKARNMRRSHRGSRKDSSRSVVESRDDIETGSPDVDAGTEIREGSLGVGNSGGGDGDSLFGTSGRDVGNVLILISGGNDNRDAAVKELEEVREFRTNERFDVNHEAYLGDGTVDGVRSTTSKTQRGDGGGSSSFEFGGDEVEARDTVNGRRPHVNTVPHNEKPRPSHVRVFTGAVSTKNPDSDDIGGLGNTAKRSISVRLRE